MSITRYYTETVVLYSPTTATSSTSTSTWAWGTEPGWSTAPTTIKAAVNPTSGRVAFAGEKETLFAGYKLFCSDTVALAAHDKAVYAGSTYDVIFVKDTLDRGHHKLAYLKDVDG